MNKIVEIFRAWSIAASPDEEQNRVAADRLETCGSCEHKKTNNLGVTYCSLCGCPLKGKVFTPLRANQKENPCPDKRWRE